MIKLRDYQEKIINGVKELLLKGIKRILTVAPTGSGKTVMFSYIASGAVSKGNKVLVISHRIELLNQAGGTFEKFGLSPVLITAKTKKPPFGNVFAAMTGTLKNRLKSEDWKKWWDDIDIIIIDEAHRSEFNWVCKYENDKVKLGFTATAKRTGKMPQLKDEYDEMVQEVDVQDLINMGYLLPDRYFGIDVDLKGVSKDNNGEFNSSDLFDRFGKKVVYEGLAREIKRIAPNEQTICFCVNIHHAVETTVKLNEAGISAKFVVSAPNKPQLPKTKDKGQITNYKRKKRAYDYYRSNFSKYSGERSDIVRRWKNGEFGVLVNASILVEGFDEPATKCVIVNLATTSENKWLQIVGRGARIFDGKPFFKLLDIGGNAFRLGHYRQQREYSLLHNHSDGGGVTPSKSCRKCDALVMVSAQYCKYCGYEFPSKEEVRMMELKEMHWDHDMEFQAALLNKKKSWIFRQIYINEGEHGLYEYGKKKGFHPFWAKRLISMYGSNKKTY